MKSLSVRRLRLLTQWLARLWALALVLLVLAFAVGEGGPPNPFRQPPAVATQLLLMLAMTLGLMIGWRWEVTGGLATLLSWVAFNVVNHAVSGRWAGGAFPLFAVPPVLYLAHALLIRAWASSARVGDTSTA